MQQGPKTPDWNTKKTRILEGLGHTEIFHWIFDIEQGEKEVPAESFFFDIKLPVALGPNGKESEQAHFVALLN